MTLTIVFALGLLTALAALLRRRALAWSLAVFMLIFSLAFGSGAVPALLLAQLQHGYSATVAPAAWQGRNVIVLLGSGSMRALDDPAAAVAGKPGVQPTLNGYPAIVRTYALYRACRQAGAQCAVLLSGGDVFGDGRSEADVYGDALLSMGMPAADVLFERDSRTTLANASRTAALLGVGMAQPRFDHIWLVTGAVHMRRSLLWFRRFGMQASPVRAEDISVRFSLLPIAANIAAGDAALHEYGGIAAFYLFTTVGIYPGPDAAVAR